MFYELMKSESYADLILRYKGKLGFFKYDIALVIVKKNFIYLNYIAPVCLEFGANYPAYGTMGSVAGWGLTEASLSSWSQFLLRPRSGTSC